jgi:hypothetical protein
MTRIQCPVLQKKLKCTRKNDQSSDDIASMMQSYDVKALHCSSDVTIHSPTQSFTL